ncbi:MAG: hypothetical protein JWR35_2289 [Marmoricola sp.]|jgi:hypothetical protein|nr:hypothetical protein [Marmoricola sp.]
MPRTFGKCVTLLVSVSLGLAMSACSGGSSTAAADPESTAVPTTGPTTGTPTATPSNTFPPQQPAPRPAAGSIEVKGSTYTYDAPKGWTDGTDQFKTINPNIENGYLDKPRNNYSDNINVIRADTEPKMAPAEAEKQFAKELDTLANNVRTLPRTTLGGVLALHQTAAKTYQAKGRPGSYKLTFDQYTTYVDDTWFAITFTYLADTPKARKNAEINGVLTSWRWVAPSS